MNLTCINGTMHYEERIGMFEIVPIVEVPTT